MKGIAVFAIVVAAFMAVFAAEPTARGPMQRFFSKYLDLDQDGILTVPEFGESFCNMRLCHKDKSGKFVPMIEFIARHDKDEDLGLSLAEFEAMVPPQPLSPIEEGPQQVHIMLNENVGEMRVMWVTKEKVPSMVRWGTSPSALTQLSNGTITTYNVGIMGGWHGWVHLVDLKGLTPGGRYYYQAGSTVDNKWSSTFDFMAATLPSDPTQTFALLGDQGTYAPMGFKVVDYILITNKQTPYNMAIHVGDVCYAGTGSTWEVEEIWDIWGDMMQDLASKVPYMIAVGNHEQYYNFTSFNTRFKFPGNEEGGVQNFWYSVNYGKVHFLFVSTEHNFSAGSPQQQFLEKDLAIANQPANRALRPWIIALGHRPLYCSSDEEWGDHIPGGRLPQGFEALFLKYGVDVYYSGHYHTYERVYPNINGTVVATGNNYVNPTAPVYVVIGNGGIFLDSDSNFVNPQPVWSAKREGFWGFARMTINSTVLHYEMLRESEGRTVDEFWITKTANQVSP